MVHRVKEPRVQVKPLLKVARCYVAKWLIRIKQLREATFGQSACRQKLPPVTLELVIDEGS